MAAGAAKQAGPAASQVYRRACAVVAHCSAQGGSLATALQAVQTLLRGGQECWLQGLAGTLQLRDGKPQASRCYIEG